MAEVPGPVPIERAGTPDIVADDALNLYISNGIVRITFARTEPDYRGGVQTVVTGRVSLSLKSTQTLAAALQEFLVQHDPGRGGGSPPMTPNAF